MVGQLGHVGVGADRIVARLQEDGYARSLALRMRAISRAPEGSIEMQVIRFGDQAAANATTCVGTQPGE